MGFPLATVCLAPSVRNRNREAFSRPKSVCRRGAAEGAVWGLQVQTRAEERPRSKSRYLVLGPWGPGGWAPGTRPSPLPCLTLPRERRTRFTTWESREPFVGSHCSQESVGRPRWAHPSWRHSQAAPAGLYPHPIRPPLPPLRVRPARPAPRSRHWPPPHPQKNPGPPRLPHRPRPAGVSPARARQRPSPSSSSPPFLRQPASSPESAPRPCAQACPAPSPPPARARAPASPQADLPAPRPAPRPGQGPGRAEPPRQRRAASPCA